jgi:Lipase (class 3)
MSAVNELDCWLNSSFNDNKLANGNRALAYSLGKILKQNSGPFENQCGDAGGKLLKEYIYELRDKRPPPKCKQPPPLPLPPRPLTLGDLKTADIIAALTGKTPLAYLQRYIQTLGGHWTSDDRSWAKAYVFACFSEVAYLHLLRCEIKNQARFQIYPSILLRELIRHNLQIDIRSAIRFVGDVPEDGIRVIETENFVYLIIATSEFVVISVRGSTAALRDWVVNFRALKTRVDHRGYHRGFYDEACRACKDVRDAVNGAARSPLPIYFTGHSAGAAVAAVLAQIWPKGFPSNHDALRLCLATFCYPRGD